MSIDAETHILQLLIAHHKDGGKFRFNLDDLDSRHLVGPNEDAVMTDVKLRLYKEHSLLLFTIGDQEYSVASPAEVEEEGGLVIQATEIVEAHEVLGSAKATAEYVKGKMNGCKNRH